MKKYQSFSSENFQVLKVKFSIYLNRRVFVMCSVWYFMSKQIYAGINDKIWNALMMH